MTATYRYRGRIYTMMVLVLMPPTLLVDAMSTSSPSPPKSISGVVTSSVPATSTSATSTAIRIMPPSMWHAEARAHRETVGSILHLVGHENPDTILKLDLTDPIANFMCDYYRIKPRRLLAWSPGPLVGVAQPFQDESTRRLLLRGTSRHGIARDLLFDSGGVNEDVVGMFDPKHLPSATLDAFRVDRSILVATESRAPIFSCFGLHEWAILYHPPGTPEPIRHQERDNPDLKLRVSQETLNGVVEGRIPKNKDTAPLRCTHFDAIRFFHPDARPHNTVVPEPSRSTQAINEQPGCVHSHMDLLFYALRLGPFLPSDILRECLQCAMASRAVDVRATPYAVDDPICVETVSGRKEYARAQEELFEKAEPVRRRLIEAYGPILGDVE